MNSFKCMTSIIGAVVIMASCGSRGDGNSANSLAYDLDALGVPEFVKTNYIDLSKVTRVSKFRSSEGHDYSDSVESCRSMKHYFSAPDESTVILSPVAGTITRLDQEWAGTQMRIQSDGQPAFTFIIFHVTPVKTFTVGDKVGEGQEIGTHIGLQTSSDIAVEVIAENGWRLVSYFETLTDQAFAPYEARGITSRSQVIISKEDRDAHPLTCHGETFTNASSDPLEKWVTF